MTTVPVALSSPEPVARAGSPFAAVTRRTGLRNVSLPTALVVAGAILLPLGLLTILLGWYGIANSAYTYDQLTYLLSGGVLGLALTVTGGFLLFGAWLLQMARDQKSASAEVVSALHELIALQSRAPAPAAGSAGLVTAGRGRTLHRGDCGLIADREDLRPVRQPTTDLTNCRVCLPDGGATV